jgi:hypothetical protein
VGLHDRKGRAAAHEVAVVATPGVVVLQPALELGVKLSQASEVLAVESRPVELLERGALEALADRVVVRRARRDPVVTDAKLLKTAGEPMTGELGPIISQHPGKLGADAGQPLGDVVDEAGRVTG